MAPKTKEQKEIERRALLTPEELAVEDAEKGKMTGENKDKKEDIVEVKRSDFNKLMSTMEKQAKDIDLLMKTADKGRIAKELSKEGQNLIKQCKVRMWDGGPLVVAWKMTVDRCEVVNGRWIEEQLTDVVLEDGEVFNVPLLEFYRKTLKKVDADIVARTEEIDENNEKITKLKLQFPTGKVILLNSAFVN